MYSERRAGWYIWDDWEFDVVMNAAFCRWMIAGKNNRHREQDIIQEDMAGSQSFVGGAMSI